MFVDCRFVVNSVEFGSGGPVPRQSPGLCAPRTPDLRSTGTGPEPRLLVRCAGVAPGQQRVPYNGVAWPRADAFGVHLSNFGHNTHNII